ncbi:MAG TPA: LLM class F420-dependent oxidoreductase, partial [Kineosporiaceae bacterium]
MGARSMNFHADLFASMGYPAEVEAIQEAFLSGRRADAVAAVPDALIEDIALVGPAAKVREEVQRWEETLVTTLIISTSPAHLPTVVEALELS